MVLLIIFIWALLIMSLIIGSAIYDNNELKKEEQRISQRRNQRNNNNEMRLNKSELAAKIYIYFKRKELEVDFIKALELAELCLEAERTFGIRMSDSPNISNHLYSCDMLVNNGKVKNDYFKDKSQESYYNQKTSKKAEKPKGVISIWKLLGVEKGSSCSEIKKAYLTKAKIYHPDKGGTKEQFQVLSNAYNKALKFA